MTTNPISDDPFKRLVCHKHDRSMIIYKLARLPAFMRDDVVSGYNQAYQSALMRYELDNPVKASIATREARIRGQAYLESVVDMLKARHGKQTKGMVFLETPDRLRLQFLKLWSDHQPHHELIQRETLGALDDEDRKQLKRQRKARWDKIRAFCKAEGLPFPSGKPDDQTGVGGRFKRFMGEWLDKAVGRRNLGEIENRARLACRVSAFGEHYVTDDAYKRWQDSQKKMRQYMQDTVFISHDDDEVEMKAIYDSTTANPANRKIQLITQVKGMTRYAEKHGYQFVMITPTLASEHHPAPKRGEDGKLARNINYKTRWTPKASHKHLNTITERVFSEFERRGIEFFGFKGVEAHKDGTPHHHIMLFYKGKMSEVKAIAKWYYLEIDQIAGELGDYKQRGKMTSAQWSMIRSHLKRTQPGALKKRVTFVQHDANKGTLSNYVLKALLNYAIKDVMIGETDPNMTEGERQAIEDKRVRQERTAAWANLWGIRQFTTLRTGAPVGVYRELRRIHEPVDGSTQLEQERLSVVGTFGTPQHADTTTRQNADFCKFMELRRHAPDDVKPVELVMVDVLEPDGVHIQFNDYDEALGRVSGLRSMSEGLEVQTRVLKWRAVNVPKLIDVMVDVAAGLKPENELRETLAQLVAKARETRELHKIGRGVFHWPESAQKAKALHDRLKPIVTWKIRNNPTESPDEGGIGKNSVYRSDGPPDKAKIQKSAHQLQKTVKSEGGALQDEMRGAA